MEPCTRSSVVVSDRIRKEENFREKKEILISIGHTVSLGPLQFAFVVQRRRRRRGGGDGTTEILNPL
jgi:hypothetical protein